MSDRSPVGRFPRHPDSGVEDGERCSFCGSVADAAHPLIAGPGVFICWRCVAVCNDILRDETDS